MFNLTMSLMSLKNSIGGAKKDNYNIDNNYRILNLEDTVTVSLRKLKVIKSNKKLPHSEDEYLSQYNYN